MLLLDEEDVDFLPTPNEVGAETAVVAAGVVGLLGVVAVVSDKGDIT